MLKTFEDLGNTYEAIRAFDDVYRGYAFPFDDFLWSVDDVVSASHYFYPYREPVPAAWYHGMLQHFGCLDAFL